MQTSGKNVPILSPFVYIRYRALVFGFSGRIEYVLDFQGGAGPDALCVNVLRQQGKMTIYGGEQKINNTEFQNRG